MPAAPLSSKSACEEERPPTCPPPGRCWTSSSYRPPTVSVPRPFGFETTLEESTVETMHALLSDSSLRFPAIQTAGHLQAAQNLLALCLRGTGAKAGEHRRETLLGCYQILHAPASVFLTPGGRREEALARAAANLRDGLALAKLGLKPFPAMQAYAYLLRFIHWADTFKTYNTRATQTLLVSRLLSLHDPDTLLQFPDNWRTIEFLEHHLAAISKPVVFLTYRAWIQRFMFPTFKRFPSEELGKFLLMDDPTWDQFERPPPDDSAASAASAS